MHVPAFPSSHYRATGRPHAVTAWGLVLFLTPEQYAAVRAATNTTDYPDATEEQISLHDQWYEQARLEAEEDLAELDRLFRRAV